MLVSLFVISFILLILDSTGVISGALGFARDPLASVTDQASGLNNVLQRPRDLQSAQLEILALRERVNVLENENEQLRALRAEYFRLSELLAYSSSTPSYERVTASVIGRGPNPLFQDLIIDKGSNDGIEVGMPVESTRGLVGQIFRVSQESALVILITDSESAIPGRLTASRSTGIVQGSTGGLLTMEWIDLDAQVDLNTDVTTSGLDSTIREARIANRFPPNMPIGRIIEVNRGEAELFQQVTIQPFVDFDALEAVFVITDFETTDTSVFESEDGSFSP